MVYITKQGKEGAEAIAKMMSDMRSNPPKKLGSSAVVTIKDYQLREETDLKSVRPSGTEPKIKFYFGVREPLAEGADIDKADKAANAKIEAIKRDLGI